MATYYFYNPDDGREYGVNGPSTLTQAQAQRIFDQQRAAGALIGLQVGEQITPEFQLANGLKTAEASVLTDLKNLSLQGLTANRAPVSTPVTDGITTANYAKQPDAAGQIKNISRAEVTGVLAQVKNLTKQLATEATNLGAGKYAFTVPQLEKAGYIKAGTTATYLSQHTVSTLSVLNSPNVWTGKSGVTSLERLLQNDSLQDVIQQELMAAGLDQIAEVGIKVDALPAKNQAGLALLAALDPGLAIEWTQGRATTVIPTEGSTPTGEISNWQVPERIVRDAAYATEFSATKVNNSMRNQVEARGYTNTTQRQVLNSAANQIIGNPKVPPLTYGADPVNPALLQQLDRISSVFSTISTKTQSLLAQQTTLTNATTREAQFLALRKELSSPGTGVEQQLIQLSSQAAVTAPVSAEFQAQVAATLASVRDLIAQIDTALQFIARVLGRRTTV